MDIGSLASQGVESAAQAAAAPVASLAATVGGVLLAALLNVMAMRWRARRRRAEPAASGGDAVAPGLTASACGLGVAPYLRLAAVAVLAAFLLPAAAVVRQLWPHPDLGWPMLAGWAAVLVAVVGAWSVLPGSTAPAAAGDVPAREPRS